MAIIVHYSPFPVIASSGAQRSLGLSSQASAASYSLASSVCFLRNALAARCGYRLVL